MIKSRYLIFCSYFFVRVYFITTEPAYPRQIIEVDKVSCKTKWERLWIAKSSCVILRQSIRSLYTTSSIGLSSKMRLCFNLAPFLIKELLKFDWQAYCSVSRGNHRFGKASLLLFRNQSGRLNIPQETW